MRPWASWKDCSNGRPVAPGLGQLTIPCAVNDSFPVTLMEYPGPVSVFSMRPIIRRGLIATVPLVSTPLGLLLRTLEAKRPGRLLPVSQDHNSIAYEDVTLNSTGSVFLRLTARTPDDHSRMLEIGRMLLPLGQSA